MARQLEARLDAVVARHTHAGESRDDALARLRRVERGLRVLGGL
jgi:hypothetical protein